MLQELYTKLIGGVELLDNIRINVWERICKEQQVAHRIDNINGKNIILTGAGQGVGHATAKALAARGAHLILPCRSPERAKALKEELQREPPLPGCQPAEVEVTRLDLASLEAVRSFTREFNARKIPLSALVCNAGVMAPPSRIETRDGFEEQFQVNYLSHWLLAHELLAGQQQLRRPDTPSGRRDAKSTPDVVEGRTRVVVVTSMTHHAGHINFVDLQAQQRYKGFQQYADSKLANLLGTFELQRRIDRCPDASGNRDVVVAVHPGLLNTNLAREWFRNGCPKLLRPVLHPVLESAFPLILLPPQHAVKTMLHAITAPCEEVRGKYVANQKVVKPASRVLDEAVARRLWDASLQLTGITASPFA